MDKKKNLILWILIVAGVICTLDLTYIFFKVNLNLSAEPSFCSVNSFVDCDGVAKTNYSAFLGIPLALWGLILYSLFTFLMIAPKLDKKFPNKIFALFKNPYSYIASFGLLSFCISICLAILSIFEINKICLMCFVTYFIDLFIALVAKTPKSFFVTDIKNTIKDFLEGVKKYTALFIIVVFAGFSALYYLNTSNILSPNMTIQNPYEEYYKMEKNIYATKGNILGHQDGPIKVYVFSDFLCPHCKIANIMSHKLAKENNKVQIFHINFPLDSSCNKYITNNMHPGACVLASYAIASKKQNKYWDMTSLIYDNSPNSEEALLKLAKENNFDIEKLKKDVNSKEVQEELLTQIDFAIKTNINATPSFMISDIKYEGAMPYDELMLKTEQAYKRYLRDKNE